MSELIAKCYLCGRWLTDDDSLKDYESIVICNKCGALNTIKI